MTNNNHFHQPLKEIRREAAYGTDKVLVVMQFPDEPSETSADQLRREILTIFEKELSHQNPSPFLSPRPKKILPPLPPPCQTKFPPSHPETGENGIS